ncbi:MAG: hypothetical protein EZS28_011869 [Streblomastix strix]|uniref:Uncharacterized protein n=1 Tax=Streblomastix strix TaxID=222440 RepID=A0A5J4WCC8_9EUKA|nr:MAG: hypothetical protein EZS28_011869 [Streblomastix strix]
MQQVVDDYNNTKHSAFKNKFTPAQVNESEDLEGIYIRQKMKDASSIKELQTKDKLLDLHQGNIIMIHLDLSKTQHNFEKKRRQFNEIATFINYSHGNVICELLRPYKDIKTVEVPIYYTKKVAESIDTLHQKYKRTFKLN